MNVFIRDRPILEITICIVTSVTTTEQTTSSIYLVLIMLSHMTTVNMNPIQPLSGDPTVSGIRWLLVL